MGEIIFEEAMGLPDMLRKASSCDKKYRLRPQAHLANSETDHVWTNQDLDLLSTSKWSSEPQFCERYEFGWLNNG